MLSFLAKQIIKKYKPAIVAVIPCGAETDPRAAIAAALSAQFVVAWTQGAIKTKQDAISAILNAAGKSTLEQFFGALRLIGKKRMKWPEVILLSIANINALEELEEFSNFLKFDFIVVLPPPDKSFMLPETVEKFLKPNTRLIVKHSHKSSILPAVRKKCKMLTYSSPAADIFSSDIILQSNGGIKGIARFGISFKINYKGTVLPVRISRSINEKEVCNILIAALAGLEMGMNLVEIASTFGKYRPVGGMKAVEGIKHSSIIDGSASCNFAAAIGALDSFPKLESARKLVVIGDIFGLGFETEAKHREIGKKIFGLKPDLVFCAGERANFTFDELRRLRFPAERIFKFNNADEVEKMLQPKIKEDDLILVIGSKQIGLGKVVRQIMANPPV